MKFIWKKALWKVKRSDGLCGYGVTPESAKESAFSSPCKDMEEIAVQVKPAVGRITMTNQIFRREYSDIFYDENNNEFCYFGDRRHNKYRYFHSTYDAFGLIECWTLKDTRSDDEKMAFFFADMGKLGMTFFFGVGSIILYLDERNPVWFLLTAFSILLWPLDAFFHALRKTKGYTWENDEEFRNDMHGQEFFGFLLCFTIVWCILDWVGILK